MGILPYLNIQQNLNIFQYKNYQNKHHLETKAIHTSVSGAVHKVEAKVDEVRLQVEDHVQRLEKREEMVTGNATQNIDKLIKLVHGGRVLQKGIAKKCKML